MLRQQLANLQKLPDESVAMFLARARSIMTDLKSMLLPIAASLAISRNHD